MSLCRMFPKATADRVPKVPHPRGFLITAGVVTPPLTWAALSMRNLP